MDNLSNCFLVASQDLVDGFFEKKVIYILEHNSKEGVLGFAVNHPIRSIKIKNLVDFLGLSEKISTELATEDSLTLYQGGTVNIEKAFILRSSFPLLVSEMDSSSNHKQNKAEDSLQQLNHQKPSLVDSPEELKSIVVDASFDQHFFMLGHVGWSPQQLEREIELGYWHIAPYDEQIIFGDSKESSWELALQSINIDPNHLVGGLGHA